VVILGHVEALRLVKLVETMNRDPHLRVVLLLKEGGLGEGSSHSPNKSWGLTRPFWVSCSNAGHGRIFPGQAAADMDFPLFHVETQSFSMARPALEEHSTWSMMPGEMAQRLAWCCHLRALLLLPPSSGPKGSKTTPSIFYSESYKRQNSRHPSQPKSSQAQSALALASGGTRVLAVANDNIHMQLVPKGRSVEFVQHKKRRHGIL
jgi:hypothetical protein